MGFVEDARALQPELAELRRALHRTPEIGLDLPRTQELVLQALEPLGLEVTSGEGLSSVTAVLRGGRPGPAVLLRGDMDALPVVEETGWDFASTNGSMHACGHDLHTAGLAGAARLLAARRDELPGSVVFMFQPGEEGKGGARLMIDQGVLDAAGERVVGAYGIHVMPGPMGQFVTRPGPLMACVSELHVTIVGAGGHGSMAHTALDPVPALLEVGTALHAMVTRRFNVFDPVVVTVTQLQAGEAVNVIPDRAKLGATVRSLSPEHVAKLETETRRLAEGIAAAHGCTAEVDFVTDYPVTVNDPDEAEWVLQTLGEVFGKDRAVERPTPLMGAEDFSYVLEQVPGAFVFLGATPVGVDLDTVAYNHSPRVLHDDAVLGDQAAALAELAWRRLERG